MISREQFAYKTETSDFNSKNVKCRGDLYIPDNVTKPPIIVMAHGFAAEKAFGLSPYAEYFASNGLAVYVFDYRCFGDSDGEPRNYVDPFRHLQDWKAAIAHVRSLPGINNNKIALWGSSFGGGHVIVTAAKDKHIAAIVAQVPHVDPISTVMMRGLKFLWDVAINGTRDILRILTCRSPHYVKVVGHPDEVACLNAPEAYTGYLSIVPEDTTWENKCPARIGLTFGLYRPIAYANKIECPALLILAEKDTITCAKAVEKTANKIPKGELVKYPFGHFEIYTGEEFEDAVNKQCQFFLTHLAS